MGVLDQTVWLDMLEEELRDPTLEKVRAGIKDDSAFVYSRGGAVTVNIPNAGSTAAVTAGNDTYPVAVTKRTNTLVTYNLTNYEKGPILVNWKDGKSAPVDEHESILRDSIEGIGIRIARDILIGQYHNTSGLYRLTSGADAPAHAPGGTGNRKSFVGADLKAAMAIMDKTSVTEGDWYLFADSIMYWQLMTDLGYNSSRDDVQALSNGTTMNLLGTTLIKMPNVVYAATGAGAVRTYGHAGATTDMGVALLVKKSCTSMAMTEIAAMIKEGDPTYFGDLYSATVMGGGKYRRYDKYGVVPIIQTGT